MKKPRPPVFVASRGYRRRRVIDAIRLVPLLGLSLFMLPILWRSGAGEVPATVSSGVYLFVVWFGLIGVAFVLPRLLGAYDDASPGPGTSATEENDSGDGDGNGDGRA